MGPRLMASPVAGCGRAGSAIASIALATPASGRRTRMPDFGAGGRRLAGRGGVVFCAREPVRLVDATFLAAVFFAGDFFAGVFFAGFAGFFVGALSEYSAAESSDRRL